MKKVVQLLLKRQEKRIDAETKAEKKEVKELDKMLKEQEGIVGKLEELSINQKERLSREKHGVDWVKEWKEIVGRLKKVEERQEKRVNRENIINPEKRTEWNA